MEVILRTETACKSLMGKTLEERKHRYLHNSDKLTVGPQTTFKLVMKCLIYDSSALEIFSSMKTFSQSTRPPTFLLFSF